MSMHLKDNELATAVAGLELELEQQAHLRSCLECRREVQRLQELVAERRDAIEASAPDWPAQRQQIMARLPAAAVVPIRRHRWLRPLVAMAAAVVVAVGVTMIVGDQARGPDVDLEQILAEVDATLDSDEIPGFAPLVAFAEFDAELDAEVPGLEALGTLVPDVDEVESLFLNGVS